MQGRGSIIKGCGLSTNGAWNNHLTICTALPITTYRDEKTLDARRLTNDRTHLPATFSRPLILPLEPHRQARIFICGWNTTEGIR